MLGTSQGSTLPTASRASTSYPVADSITHARITSYADEGAPNTQLYNTCTRMWSPRRRVRVDPDRKHKYDASISMPLQQPEIPWAIYLASSDHRFRLLALDFDTSRFGAEQARTDSDRLAAHLDDLGVHYLRAHSGPTGGQHIWLRLGEDGAAPAAVGELNRVLVQHYPTFDKSPWETPIRGCAASRCTTPQRWTVRPPPGRCRVAAGSRARQPRDDAGSRQLAPRAASPCGARYTARRTSTAADR